MRYAALLAYGAANLWAVEPAYGEFWIALLESRIGGRPDPEMAGFNAREISNTRAGEIRRADGGVAVMPVMGPISQRLSGMDAMCGGGFATSEASGKLASLVDDPGVKAILMQYDSPGGTVAGVQEFAQQIADSRGSKPIVSQVDAMACSAAYWLAAAGDEVVITPSGSAGSIGVYTVHTDQSAKNETDGVKHTIIRNTQSPFKAEAPSTAPLSADARDFTQQRVDETAGDFIKALSTYRGVSQQTVRDKFGKGRTFGAQESVSRGLADRVGTMQDTLARYVGGGTPQGGNRKPSRNMTAMFADGGMPSVREFQAHLREQGASKSTAERIASAAAGMLRAETEAGIVMSDEARRELRETLDLLQRNPPMRA